MVAMGVEAGNMHFSHPFRIQTHFDCNQFWNDCTHRVWQWAQQCPESGWLRSDVIYLFIYFDLACPLLLQKTQLWFEYQNRAKPLCGSGLSLSRSQCISIYPRYYICLSLCIPPSIAWTLLESGCKVILYWFVQSIKAVLINFFFRHTRPAHLLTTENLPLTNDPFIANTELWNCTSMMTSDWSIASAASSSPVRSYEMVNFRRPPAAVICRRECRCWSHSRKHACNHFILFYSNYSAFKGKDFDCRERTCGW